MMEVVVHQELLQSTGEILLIVVIQIESLEEEGIPMREVDLQKEIDIQVEIEDLPRQRVPSNGRPPDRSPREPSGGGGLPDRGRPADDGGPPDDGGSSSGNRGPPKMSQ